MIDDVPQLEMQGISKAFPGVQALNKVHLRAFRGECMALLGENGAGKSTLMKILSGVHCRDEGTMIYNGRKYECRTPKDAQEQGIAIIHQELNLISEMTVGENIFLGREPVGPTLKIQWKKLYEESARLLKRLNMDIDPKTKVSTLSVGKAQMVEIAKALSLNAELIIMDEPTDALTDVETDSLFDVIRDLKSQGKGLIYISHRLPDVFAVCDRATILRDGTFIAEEKVTDLTEDRIIEMMVGRSLTQQFPEKIHVDGDVVLDVRNLTNALVKDISFSVAGGEVLGIAGLMGAGRTELAKTIFGDMPHQSGSVWLDGSEVRIDHPQKALELGISYVSEDRKTQGLILGMNIKENITLPALKNYQSILRKISVKKEMETTEDYISKFAIKTPGPLQKVKNLSGGNQQKVSIAKGLVTRPRVLILDEPTRGVDVGAKKEIYELITALKKEGLSILLISSEMPEILGMSDRVLVMFNGGVSGILSHEEANQENIMKLAVGMTAQRGTETV